MVAGNMLRGNMPLLQLRSRLGELPKTREIKVVCRSATARLDRFAVGLDHCLSQVDVQLTPVESRLNAVRTDLDEVRRAAEKIDAENADLPHVRAEIELLLDRLVPIFERADALADSLRSGAAVFRAAADIVDQFKDDPDATVRARTAADKNIDRAVESLNGLRVRAEALKSAKAVQLTRELVTLGREAIASSDRLAEVLADVRQEIAVVRSRTDKWRDKVVTWIYIAATAGALICLWGGLGQLCLIGWGRRA